ncbi:MAG: FAD-dependent oxidoreductase [Robiginitomaculum sp.]
MKKTCLIIGASHAGGQAAISLRQAGYEDDILLIGDEGYLPYHRPPLSKDFLFGGKDLGDILIRPQDTYDVGNIETVLGQKVHSIERKDKLIFMGEGHVIAYDKVIIATGASARKLPIKGVNLPGVFYLRSANDVLAIKQQAAAGKRAVIIGGGYIGLETAASLTKQGMKVTVLEMEERILQRVTAPVMSSFYKRIHEEEGVQIIENCTASEIKEGLMVYTKDGQKFDADIVIIGIGVIPNQQLARKCGLEVGNGIIVDAFCRTSDPDIYAIGDVAWHYNSIYDTRLRIESVPNATDMAKTVAAHLCGIEKPYNQLPWFWSDQFDLKLQIAGLSSGYEEVVLRGDPDNGRSFAAFYFKEDRLLAVDAVNRPQEYMIGKRFIPVGKSIDKKALTDENVPLKSFLK